MNKNGSRSTEKYENIQASKQKKDKLETSLNQNQLNDVTDYFEDPVNKHIKSVEKTMVQTQTNIFDPINYNLFFNNLKKEQYNTQGFSSDEENIIGFDKSIYTFA